MKIMNSSLLGMLLLTSKIFAAEQNGLAVQEGEYEEVHSIPEFSGDQSINNVDESKYWYSKSPTTEPTTSGGGVTLHPSNSPTVPTCSPTKIKTIEPTTSGGGVTL